MLDRPLHEICRQKIWKQLRRTRMSKTDAARLAGISRQTLWKFLEDRPDSNPSLGWLDQLYRRLKALPTKHRRPHRKPMRNVTGPPVRFEGDEDDG
jgi:hypothetical protein